MRMAVVSANLGGYDYPYPTVRIAQTGVDVGYYHFTDKELPPRPLGLSYRMQAKIPKMFAWDLVAGYDVYVWMDAPFAFSLPTTAAWWLQHLGDHEIAVFRHPVRRTIAEEAAHLQAQIDRQDAYTLTKYVGEDLVGQLSAVTRDALYEDTQLFAAGAFCYRPTPAIRQALTAWWVNVSRFHVNDQLSWPYVLRTCAVSVIHENIYKSSHLTFGGATT